MVRSLWCGLLRCSASAVLLILRPCWSCPGFFLPPPAHPTLSSMVAIIADSLLSCKRSRGKGQAGPPLKGGTSRCPAKPGATGHCPALSTISKLSIFSSMKSMVCERDSWRLPLSRTSENGCFCRNLRDRGFWATFWLSRAVDRSKNEQISMADGFMIYCLPAADTGRHCRQELI